MKIICDNQEEYDKVVKACKYIHDYSVFISGVSKKTKIEIIKEFGRYNPSKEPISERIKPDRGSRWVGFSLDHDLEEYEILNVFAHGIGDATEETRKKYIEIKKD